MGIFGRGKDQGSTGSQPNVLRGSTGWSEPNVIATPVAAPAPSAAPAAPVAPVSWAPPGASAAAAPAQPAPTPVASEWARHTAAQQELVRRDHAKDPIYRLATRVARRGLRPLLIPLGLIVASIAVAVAVPSLKTQATMALLFVGGAGAVMYWAISLSRIYIEANATRGASILFVVLMSILHWHIWAMLVGGLLAMWVAVAYASFLP